MRNPLRSKNIPKRLPASRSEVLHAAKWDLNVTLQSSTTHDEEADCRTRHCHYRHLGTDDCIVGIACMSGWVELVAQTVPLLRSLSRMHVPSGPEAAALSQDFDYTLSRKNCSFGPTTALRTLSFFASRICPLQPVHIWCGNQVEARSRLGVIDSGNNVSIDSRNGLHIVNT